MEFSLGEESVAVGLGSSERAEETGARSAASLLCHAEPRVGGERERAGERSPPSEIAVRGDRASGRSEQMRRNGRALKRASTLKEQKPVRSSEASSARPNHQAAWRGLGRPSRVALLGVLTERRGSPSESPRRWQVTSAVSRSSCVLHSSVNY